MIRRPWTCRVKLSVCTIRTYAVTTLVKVNIPPTHPGNTLDGAVVCHIPLPVADAELVDIPLGTTPLHRGNRSDTEADLGAGPL